METRYNNMRLVKQRVKEEKENRQIKRERKTRNLVYVLSFVVGIGLNSGYHAIKDYFPRIDLPTESTSQIYDKFLKDLQEKEKLDIPEGYSIPPKYLKPEFYFSDKLKTTNI